MTIINNLRGIEAQNLFHAVAYGKHAVTGQLAKSTVISSHVYTQQMLGRGEWNRCLGLWYKGLEIKPADYQFYPGTLSTGMGDVVQGQDSVFDTDVPHSGFAWIRSLLPDGVPDLDVTNNPPNELRGIFETSVIDNYDSSGTVIDHSYSTNPARQVADLILAKGGRPSSRIDWGAWQEWHDYLIDTISYDYRLLPDFDGFGLTVSLYNGTNFDTFVSQRIDPYVEFVLSSGSPGIGVNTDNFSYRAEGYIKSNATETRTFYLKHDDGARLWIDGTLLIDQWTTTGSHSATFAMTGGTFYSIKIEWKEITGNAELRLEWEGTSQTREVVSHRALYPLTVDRPRYETHPFFSQPTRLDDAVRTVLSLCNSTVQDVNGKLRFFCFEQLVDSSFHFTNSRIVDGSVKMLPRNVNTMRNTWQAHFRDVDSQYLEEPIDPVLIERPDLIDLATRRIDGEAIELFSCSVHQAYRTLDRIVKRACDAKYQMQFTGTADTFPVLAGDRVSMDIEFRSWENKEMLIVESNDSSSEETADERTFVATEWVE